MQWQARNTVACVVEKDGYFLMVEERINGQVVWNQPAGHLEAGETLAGAAVRETLEETTWHVRPVSLTGLYQYSAGPDKTFLRCAFAAEPLEADAERGTDPEIERVLWLSAADIRAHEDMLRSPLVRAAIEDYLAGHQYPLSLLKTV